MAQAHPVLPAVDFDDQALLPAQEIDDLSEASRPLTNDLPLQNDAQERSNLSKALVLQPSSAPEMP